MKKKVLSLLLTLALCLGLTPTLGLSALAAEEFFEYTAPDGVVYRYAGGILGGDMEYKSHFLAVGYEGEPTSITIPSFIEGTYINGNGEEVFFSKQVEGIARNAAFERCDSLETVTIQGCPVLDSGFANCSSLRVLDLSQCTATEISTSLAYQCGNLETVYLPASLTRLGSSTFGHCDNLRDVYFLGDKAPTVSSYTTLHNSFDNAAVFHVPAGASGYRATRSDDAYQHAVVYGNGDDVSYGADFSLEFQTSNGVSGTVLDMGTFWAQDSLSSRGRVNYTVKNTGSDTLTFTVTKGSGNSDNVSCSTPYNKEYSGRLFPGETLSSIPITLDLGLYGSKPGSYEETFTITGTGYVTKESHSETITVRYTVKDQEDAFTFSQTEVDFGDIPAGLSLEEMPTVTITATNNMSRSAYFHLPMTNSQYSGNICYVEYLEGSNKTPVPAGQSITFRIRMTPFGLQCALAGDELKIPVSLLDKPIDSSSSALLGGCDIKVKVNPVHSAGLAISDNLLDLGTVKEGYYNNSYAQSFTVTNTGTQDVTLSADKPTNFILSGGFGGTVKPNGRVWGTIQPKNGLKPGTYEETITFRGGEASTRLRVRFTVEGEKKEGMALSSSYLSFGHLAEGYPQPAAQTVTVENKGTETITLTQPTAWDFEVGRLSRTTLAAGQTATFTVRPKAGLTANGTTARSYNETVALRTSMGLTESVELSFTVDPAKKEGIALSSSYLSFGHLAEGYPQPAAQTVTVENKGTETITLTQPTAWDYEVGRLSRTTLAAGQSATFTVRPKAGLTANGTAARNYNETVALRTSAGLMDGLELYFAVMPKEGAPVVFDPDDAPDVWAQGEVAAAITANLVPQSLQSKYTRNITRAEFCALATQFYETMTGREITGRSTFVDTDDVNVQKMAYVKVVDGRGNGIFDPDSGITRQEAAAILSRLAAALGYTLPDSTTSFKDQALIANWAEQAVGQVNAAGIMRGMGDNVFSPGTNYTRQQSYITIMRLYQFVDTQA